MALDRSDGGGRSLWRETQGQAASAGVTPRADWAAARVVVGCREGVARMVGGGSDFAFEDESGYRRE